MRESALLGILGLHTLGFFIDSAFESFRLDIALILIITSAILNISADSIGRLLRQYLHLTEHHVTFQTINLPSKQTFRPNYIFEFCSPN